MKNRILRIIYGSRFLGFIAAPLVFGLSLLNTAYAQSPRIIGIPNLIDIGDVRTSVICTVVNTLFWILIALTVAFVVVAAYKYLTSGGEQEKVGSATKTFTYAAVAVVVALLAKGFPFIIGSIFGAVLGNAGC